MSPGIRPERPSQNQSAELFPANGSAGKSGPPDFISLLHDRLSRAEPAKRHPGRDTDSEERRPNQDDTASLAQAPVFCPAPPTQPPAPKPLESGAASHPGATQGDAALENAPPTAGESGETPGEPPPAEGDDSGAPLVLKGFSSLTLAEQKAAVPKVLPESLIIPTEGKKGAGMTAAKQEPMAVESQKQNEIAAVPEQKLPGAAGSSRAPQIVPVEFSSAAPAPIPVKLPSRQDLEGHIIFPAGEASGQALDGLPSGTGEILSIAPAPVSDSALVQSIGEQIKFLHARNEDSLEVTLTPDGETELFLKVDRVDGEILVRVRFERGNFDQLESHWPQLQQTFAAQGIKVETLATGANTGGAPWHGQNQAGQHESRESRLTPTFEQEARKPLSATKQTTRFAQLPAHGWQGWA